MATKTDKPNEVIDHGDGWQFVYDGWNIVVPKDQVKNKTEAAELAEKEYKRFKRQPNPKPIEE